jgi:hypothetical protein
MPSLVSKLNRKSVERGIIGTPNTQIRDNLISKPGTVTSI